MINKFQSLAHPQIDLPQKALLFAARKEVEKFEEEESGDGWADFN